jgi:hypothetical protein
MPDEATQKKLQAFLDDYKKLVDQHKCDFVNYPQFVPDGAGGWKVVVQTQPVDTSQMPQPSPFQDKKD